MKRVRLAALACAIALIAAAPPSSQTVLVYEDPRVPSTRTIALHVAVYPSEQISTDAVFFLTGGPGEASTVPQRFPASLLFALQRTHDLVFVDPRGTGQSDALKCELFPSAESHFAGYYQRKAVSRCHEELAERANLNLYTTWFAADDLDRVRTELGYRRIFLYAASYGGQIALEYLRRYGNHASGAVLSDVNGIGTAELLNRPREAQAAMDEMLFACERDNMCATRFPQLRNHLSALLARFDKGYADVVVRNPESGQPFPARLSRAALVETLRRLIISPETFALGPVVVEEAYQRNYDPIAIAKVRFDGITEDGVAAGVQLSEYCAERVPFVTDAAVYRLSRDTFYGMDTFRELQDACNVWKVRPVSGAVVPVRTSVPVLYIVPAADEALMRSMPHAHELLLTGNLLTVQSPCADAVVLDFFDAPAAARPRTIHCASFTETQPFALTLPASLAG